MTQGFFTSTTLHTKQILSLPHRMHQLSLRSVDLSESRQPNLYAATIVPGVFALVCVCLRFWSRANNRAGFWVDDWLILCALVSFQSALLETLSNYYSRFVLLVCGPQPSGV